MRIKAVPFNQHGTTMYSAVMSAKNLVDQYKVDVWHPTNENGYQRAISPTRAKQFGRYVASGEISAPAILANVRKENEDKIIFDKGFLEIPDDVIIWLVDGQHRVAGLEDLILSAGEKYENLEFPVIVMVGQDVYEEAKEFVVINNSQKRVRTDLGERFLQKRAKIEGTEKLLQKGIRNIEWIPTAIDVVDILNKDPQGIWHGKIRLPNEPKGTTIVSQKAFSDSLKPLLKEDGRYFGSSAGTVSSILKNYWDAIQQVFHEPFENPEGYVLMKTTGVVTLHGVLPRIVQAIGNDEPKTSEFVKILERIPILNDAARWSSPNGEYSRMTGQKGFLIIKLDLLEEIQESLMQVTA